MLCQAHGLTPEQVVAIASHDGGKQALETVQRLLPVLCQQRVSPLLAVFYTNPCLPSISSLRATSRHKNFHCHNELLERPKCYAAAQE